MAIPVTQYAKTADGVHIAYQVVGDGATDLVFVPGWVSHLEAAWEYPPYAEMLWRLGALGRLVWFDRRGLGLSDRPAQLQSLEEQMADLLAVLDTVGVERPAIFCDKDACALGLLFAATHPQRVRALALYAGIARFLPDEEVTWATTPERLALFVDLIERTWGRESRTVVELLAPSMIDDAVFGRWYPRFCRLGASPSAIVELLRLWARHDMRAVLPAVSVPTLLVHRDRELSSVKHAYYVAEHIPAARLVVLPGRDFLLYAGDTNAVIDEVEEFFTGTRTAPRADRVLATVLFTDIAESTRLATVRGDRTWRSLLDAHDRIVDRELDRFGGRKVNPTGDGMVATFDGPARAIRCARAIIDATDAVGLHVRAGLHTGEVELRGSDISGIAVHIAARVSALAEPGAILVSRTVTDLVAGSNLQFTAQGEHTLKGIDGTWALFAAT